MPFSQLHLDRGGGQWPQTAKASEVGEPQIAGLEMQAELGVARGGRLSMPVAGHSEVNQYAVVAKIPTDSLAVTGGRARELLNPLVCLGLGSWMTVAGAGRCAAANAPWIEQRNASESLSSGPSLQVATADFNFGKLGHRMLSETGVSGPSDERCLTDGLEAPRVPGAGAVHPAEHPDEPCLVQVGRPVDRGLG